MIDPHLDQLIDLALSEDLGGVGDLTTQALVSPYMLGRGELWAKEPMVISGLEAFERVFQRVDPGVKVDFELANGDETLDRQRVARLEGSMQSLLVAERTALNLIQRTSGIATLAREAVKAIGKVKGTRLRILDTRKTIPGMRALSKAAVRHGGAVNHRFGLFDGILIKDNHIAACNGSITEALKRARESAPRLAKVEIEVATLEQLLEAIAAGASIVLLDNMDDEMVAQAVEISKGRVELEVSGGVTLERLPVLAELGVDFVSMGALTHSARAVDLSLELMLGKAKRGRVTTRG